MDANSRQLVYRRGDATADTAAAPGWPRETDQARWFEILDAVDQAALAEEFLNSVRAVPGYENPPMPWSEIRRTAVESFRVLIDVLRDGQEGRLFEIAAHVGISRARAEVPMASLLLAIQFDFQVLWNGILNVADDADSQVLIRHANWVWTVVDGYVRQTQSAYIAEERRMADETASVERALLAELFRIEELSGQRLAKIAEQLGISPTAPFLIAAADEERIPALRRGIAQLERAGFRVYSQYRDASLVVFVETQRRSVAQHEAIEGLRMLPVGLIERVTGLPALRRAVGLVVDLAQLPNHDRAMTPARGWSRLVRRDMDARFLTPFLDIQDSLDGCGPAERKNLVAAVRAFLETGNVGEAAQRTYCHRNTLTNRLNRFRELTGIDVTVPEQAAPLVISWAD